MVLIYTKTWINDSPSIVKSWIWTADGSKETQMMIVRPLPRSTFLNYALNGFIDRSIKWNSFFARQIYQITPASIVILDCSCWKLWREKEEITINQIENINQSKLNIDNVLSTNLKHIEVDNKSKYLMKCYKEECEWILNWQVNNG